MTDRSPDQVAHAEVVAVLEFVVARVREDGQRVGPVGVSGEAIRRLQRVLERTLDRARRTTKPSAEVYQAACRIASSYGDHPSFRPHWRLQP